MGQELPERHTRTGLFRIHPDFASQHLKPRRKVLVYLPPGYYESPERRYPVLYLHDGQNLFDGNTSFIHGQEWRVDETAERLIRAGKLEPLIIVGIYNTGADRLPEYTPTRDKRGRGGNGELYSKFLTDELKPFMDRTYRTRTDAANTALGGSSLGGLISLWVGLKRPDAFGKLAILSPSVWWDEKAILKAVVKKLPLKLWVDIGTAEGDTALPDTRLLRDLLKEKGWKEGTDLSYHEFEGAGHNEASWAARFDQVLLFLFPR
ncbi:alpha/beta hydrolase-fold protein [Armatimonas sp.]|uniref:alpha/beta hydrolase n=1 Tax=Armatimonas sp. TaxID=1872638 RepID=UPI00286C4810|nr:alpha/beta hydrolase-fold protein [Armatimonas sp.]